MAGVDIFLLVRKRTQAKEIIWMQVFLWLKHQNWEFLRNRSSSSTIESCRTLIRLIHPSPSYPSPPCYSLYSLFSLLYSNSLSRPWNHPLHLFFNWTLGQEVTLKLSSLVISCTPSTILYPRFKFSRCVSALTWTSEVTLLLFSSFTFNNSGDPFCKIIYKLFVHYFTK